MKFYVVINGEKPIANDRARYEYKLNRFYHVVISVLSIKNKIKV